jgi:hypothetical protein
MLQGHGLPNQPKPERTKMHLTLRPLGRGRFAASIDCRLICESRTPFFDSARTLLSEGVSPNEILTASHEGSPVVAMRASIEKAAGLTVIEKDGEGPRIATYRPMSDQSIVSCRSPSSLAAIVGSPDAIPSEHETPFCDDHLRAFA